MVSSNSFLSSIALFGILSTTSAFAPSIHINNNASPTTTTQLKMATVPPSPTSTVGIVGRGYISILTAKLSALAGYSTWFICPPGEEDKVKSLLSEDYTEIPSNLEIVSGADTDGIDERMRKTDGLIVAVDDERTMDDGVLKYLISPDVAKNLKRVVGMSRNLNGKDMGFLVKASKISANSEVWDLGTKDLYVNFEKVLKGQVQACGDGVDYTIVRAGTLKGGACGESEYNQYLTKEYYQMTKKDIITWQLLFDCNVRGVKLAKGDVLPGPGGKAVFTATGAEEANGDTGRCALAEAMVRSLAVEKCGNMDFGVGTVEGRVPPTDDEWAGLFEAL